MEDPSTAEAREKDEEEKKSARSTGGGMDVEAEESPRKKRRTSPGPSILSAKSPRPTLALLTTAPAELPPPSFIPYDPTRRTPTAIASLINPRHIDIPNRGPTSPAKPLASPSSLQALLINHPPWPAPPSSVSFDLPDRSPRPSELLSPIGNAPSSARSSLAPWRPPDPRRASPGSHAASAPERSRQTFAAPMQQRNSPPPAAVPRGRRASVVPGPSRPDKQPTPITSLDSPPLRERSIPPFRRSVSSGPSPPERRGSQSREASRAWFSLGLMEAVDMRQWDQHQREAYQRGYTDALKAVQRGTMGVAGVQYPNPQLLKKDEAMPSEERYRVISTRRPSIGDSSRSYYPEASARATPPSHWPTQGTPSSSRQHPSQFFTQPPPHHQSTSAWANDRRAEYAQYEYTVPPPMRHQSDPANRPLAPGGPYYPAPYPRHYSYADHPTYASNPTTTTTSTSPSQLTRTGQRQLISCYPCRSRKMKCDGTKPCFQCVRRGGEAECDFAVAVRRRGKGKKPSTGEQSTGKSVSGSDGEGEGGESGQESGDERWRMEGMNLPDTGGEL